MIFLTPPPHVGEVALQDIVLTEAIVRSEWPSFICDGCHFKMLCFWESVRETWIRGDKMLGVPVHMLGELSLDPLNPPVTPWSDIIPCCLFWYRQPLKNTDRGHRIYYRNENKQAGDKWDLISSTKHIITYNSWDTLKLLNTGCVCGGVITVVKMQSAL